MSRRVALLVTTIIVLLGIVSSFAADAPGLQPGGETYRLGAEARERIAYGMGGLMFTSLIGVMMLVALYRRDKGAKRKRMRFRRRSIQFLSVGMALPAIILLALDGVFTKGVLATLFGTFFGYVLSGIGTEDGDNKPNPDKTGDGQTNRAAGAEPNGRKD